MSPEEAHLILKSWFDNSSQLLLVGTLAAVTCALRCRISRVKESGVSLTAEGGMLTFDFSDPKTDIRYSELREFPDVVAMLGLTDEHRFASTLTFLFPERVNADSGEAEFRSSDSLSLIELKRVSPLSAM